ncbi:glycosyltransferase family 4 protein [Bdellovibrio bacteriovorus]|uniref:glycosyltransferase family 4 protein n=1 Tax=Bdellovibrio bacteriovorus TaxID=959 RepID=UPI0035A6AE04
MLERILFDCTTLFFHKGPPVGISRVIESYFSIWRASSFVENVVFLQEESAFYFIGSDFSLKEKVSFKENDILVNMGCAWDYVGLNDVIRKLKQSNGLKFIQLVHDVIPFKYPYYIQSEACDNYTRWFVDMLSVCDGVLTISKSTERDLRNLCASAGIDMPRSEVIRYGDGLILSVEDICQRSPPFALSVGTLEYRKNQILLVNVWRKLIQSGLEGLPELILAGKDGWMNQNIVRIISTDKTLNGKIKVVENSSDDLLGALYSSCEFTLYPSLYEGWGLPISESLCFGKICLASDTSSMIEVAPGFVVHLDPFDIDAWTQQISRLILDREYRARLQSKVEQYVPALWDKSAQLVIEKIKAIAH